MVEQSNLAQAREVDDLIDKLREYRDKESQQEQAVKMASEKLKKEKATLEEIIGKKNKVIDELSGKTVYPLFDQIKKMEAEQDKLESESAEPTQEAEALAGEQPTLLELTQVKLERVGETSEKVKLILGERSVEITLETIELRLVGADPEEYGTFDQICDAGWAEIQKLNQDELLELFNEFLPAEQTEDTSNITNFFNQETSESSNTEEPEEKGKLKFEAYQDSDGRLCVCYDHGERKSAFGSATKILNRFGVSSVEKLAQKHLAELWQEDPSDWSYKVETNNTEDWPEQIIAMPKSDNSIVLKLNGRTRIIDTKDIALPYVSFNDQSQLQQLWLSEHARDWNPENEIAPAEGKKTRKKNKPAEVTA